MKSYDWDGLMTRWSQEMLQSQYFADIVQLPDLEYPDTASPEVITSGWLGYAGASEEQIAAAEKRLGMQLPPDYASFLRATNGWRVLYQFIPGLWSVEKIDWLRTTDADLVGIWSAPDMKAIDIYESKHIESTLRISDQEYGGTQILLLNPGVITPDGEWEAWSMAHWHPGANTYPSFWELMQELHKAFLQLESS